MAAGTLRDSEGPAAALDRSKYAVLRRARRVWAIAAIHGDSGRLRSIHKELAQRLAPGDRIVYLGNYLGYGDSIVPTLDAMLGFRRLLLARPGAFACDVAYLRGAQEEMWHKLLQLQLALEPVQVLSWMVKRGVDATIRAYGGDPEAGLGAARGGVLGLTRWTSGLREAMRARPGHYELLHGLKRAALTEDGSLLLVHGGLDPERPLDAQGDALWWGAVAFDAIRAPYDGFALVIRGCDPSRRGRTTAPPAASIDAGCGFGGPLTAACFLPSGDLADLIEA